MPIPDSLRVRSTITRITVDGAAKAIDFYKKAFRAEELYRFEAEGRVGHSELRIGDALISVADPWPGAPVAAPDAGKGNPHSGFLLIVNDADIALKHVESCGAKVFMPVTDTFYGHRCGCILDPFGHYWTLSHVKEIVADDEMRRRMETMMKEGGCGKKP